MLNHDFDFFLNQFCNQIETLSLKCCDIESITKLFSDYKFQNLKVIILSPYMISRIEKNFTDAFPSTIQSLCICSSDINSSKVSSSSRKWEREETKQNILKIDQDAFSSHLKQLKYLNLCSNNIESLVRRHFMNFINLKHLDLENNRLKRLDENIFSDLKNLKKLSLRKNELEVLDAKSFVGLESLIYLNLSHNKLSHLDVRILDNLPQFLRINLRRNALCFCEAKMLVNRFKYSKVKFIF